MAQILDMPQLSDTMRQGVLRKWRKNEGDKVSPGEVLAEIETDKATMDFEAFDEGVLLKRLIDDGATVPVGSPIAIIGKAGEAREAIDKLVDEAKARAAGDGKPAAAPKGDAAATPAPRPEPAPRPAAPAVAPAPSASSAPNGPSARPAPARVRPAPASFRPAPATTGPAGGGKILASPLARRLATDLGVDLRRVQGTGPGGRIVERDVHAAAAGGGPAPTASVEGESAGPGPAPAAQAPPPLAPATGAAPGPAPTHLVPDRRAEARPGALAPSDDIVKPLSMMRRTIARRLLESKTQVPHFYLTVEVDMEAAMEFRHQVGQLNNTKLSVNDLVIKAAALALRRVPEANASFTEEAIIQHARVDISMAVAIEDGLLTPVIRDADKKTLGQISNEARELASRARDRKLRVDEITGGTFSISNLGMYGIQQFDAIINPPEGAILSVGSVRKVPVVKGDAVVPGQRMSMTLSCDHRVIDGALGARLLQAVVSILERPISLAF